MASASVNRRGIESVCRSGIKRARARGVNNAASRWRARHGVVLHEEEADRYAKQLEGEGENVGVANRGGAS